MVTRPLVICQGQYDLNDNFKYIVSALFKHVLYINSIHELSTVLKQHDISPNIILFTDTALIEQAIHLNGDMSYVVGIANSYIETIDHEDIRDFLYLNGYPKLESQLHRIYKNILSILERRSFNKEVDRLYEIGRNLGTEKNLNKLINNILEVSMNISGAEASSFYSVIDNRSGKWSTYQHELRKHKSLRFEIAKNRKLSLEIEAMTLSISDSTIVGSSVIGNKSILIDDVHNIPKGTTYQYDASVEKKTGYSCKSMYTIPMRDQKGRVLGAIQLINKKHNHQIDTFNARDELMMEFLSGYAAIAFENSHLYVEMQSLVEDYERIIHDKNFEEGLQESELLKFSGLIEKNPSALLITDSEGLILYNNDQFTELTGYTTEDLIGKRPSILKSGQTPLAVYKTFWETLLAGDDWHGEFLNLKKNGELYWEKSSVSSIKDDDGRIKYFVNTREDISALKEANSKLTEAVRNLKQAQSVLVQNEKMVAIGQLAAGMAHEINNPLGFITSNLDTLGDYSKSLIETIDLVNTESDKAPTEFRLKMNKIQNESDIEFIRSDLAELLEETSDGLVRVHKIVEAMRAYSNIDNMSDSGEFSLNEAVETSLTMFRSIASHTCEIQEDLGFTPTITGDAGKFQQALMNILMNALEALERQAHDKPSLERMKSIHIRTQTSNDKIICSITDNGPGITAENLSQIFDPFFTTKPIGQGAGLGLSQARSFITSALSGQIKVESLIEHGTTFTIEIPNKKKTIE